MNYTEFFHFAVTAGVGCGLDHPIEWAINAHRTPKATLTPEFYASIEEHIPRFLYEMFEAIYLSSPRNVDDIISWMDNHYREDHMARGYFGFLIPKIHEYIESKRQTPLPQGISAKHIDPFSCS